MSMIALNATVLGAGNTRPRVPATFEKGDFQPLPLPAGSSSVDKALARQILEALDKANITKTVGVCGSIGLSFVGGVDLGACVVGTPLNAGIVFSGQAGGGWLPPDAHASASVLHSNALNADQLGGESVCLVGSADVGFGATASVCAGLNPGGGLSGVVAITVGIAASTTPGPSGGIFYSDSWVLANSGPPKTYRNPDGSCTNGGSIERGGYCGEGSMNGAGLPSGFP